MRTATLLRIALVFVIALSFYLIGNVLGVTVAKAQTAEFLCGAEATRLRLTPGSQKRADYIRDCVHRKQSKQKPPRRVAPRDQQK